MDEFERRLRPVNGQRPAQNLDELLNQWRGFWKKFKGTGGGGSKRGSSGSGPWLVVLVVLFVLGMLTSIYTIDVSEQGVVTRFGKYLHTTEPGLHFKLPFGIDSVTKLPSKVLLQAEFGFRTLSSSNARSAYTKTSYGDESLMLTGDLNVADVEWILQYRISDPWKYLYKVRNVTKTIRDVSMSIMRRVVGDRLVGEVLTISRVEIADEAKVLMQEVLDKYDMGIQVVAVVLQDVNPPNEVKDAFNEVNSAKQEQERDINIAEREYNKVIPEARGKGDQLIADAQGYAISLINRSKGEANKFNAVYREYSKAPQVTRKRLYLETMEEIFSSVDEITIVDSKIKGILPVYGTADALSPPSTKGATP